jgi:HK97 family phage portal protein
LGFLTNIFRRERRDNTANPAGLFSAAWDILSNTHQTGSGEPINETIAARHLTVYACVRTIAEDVGDMTIRLYKRLPKGRQEAIDDPMWRMLAIEPNNEMSSSTVWEQIAGCMALTGNSYAEILRNKEGTAVGLYPLDPRITEPVRLPTGELAYKTRVGVKDGQTRIIKAADMLHFPLWSYDGLKGLSPVAQARNDIGLAIAATKYGAKFFGNSSKPGGILTPISQVSEEDMSNMRIFWEQANSAENQGRVSVLPNDWKYTALALSPDDSQFLQTRQMSRTDVAALFRMPPTKVGDTTRQSKASAEQENLSYVTDTLRPYLVRIEREIQRKLLPKDNSMFVEFDVSERLRGDFATTMQGFAVGKQWGFYTTNIVLEKLGENPIGPEGDIYWAPVNMQNAARLLDTESIQDQPLDADPTKPIVRPGAAAPTDEERNLFAAYIPSYSKLFIDAVGRASSRSKRDAEALTPIFAPVLESISELLLTEARSQFKLPDDWNPAQKAVRDCIKSAASRAREWSAEEKVKFASMELSKALRSLHFAIYREAGATLALMNPMKLGDNDDAKN